MDRVAKQCEKRRATLQQLGEQSRVWCAARDAIELWMQQADEIVGEPPPRAPLFQESGATLQKT